MFKDVKFFPETPDVYMYKFMWSSLNKRELDCMYATKALRTVIIYNQGGGGCLL